MRIRWVILALTAAACTAGGAATTTSTAPLTTTTISTTTTTLPPECPPAPYDVGQLPDRVAENQVPAENLAIDRFTSVPGSHSTLWVDDEGAVAVALVRGSLPPEEWPGERGEVDIDGARGVAGPFEDGTWVVAWFEEPGARCDQYTMVFYPPVTPDEVEATIDSLDRVAG